MHGRALLIKMKARIRSRLYHKIFIHRTSFLLLLQLLLLLLLLLFVYILMYTCTQIHSCPSPSLVAPETNEMPHQIATFEFTNRIVSVSYIFVLSRFFRWNGVANKQIIARQTLKE